MTINPVEEMVEIQNPYENVNELFVFSYKTIYSGVLKTFSCCELEFSFDLGVTKESFGMIPIFGCFEGIENSR